MTPPGLVFLDIDGVCNSARWMRERSAKHVQICRETDLERSAVLRLNRLAAYDFVLSSSWRHVVTLPEMREMLKHHGFIGRLIARTPFPSEMTLGKSMREYARGHEIQYFLDYHPYTHKNFVIIDDSSDMVHLMPRLVRTTWEDGLLDEHVDRALAMLAAHDDRQVEIFGGPDVFRVSVPIVIKNARVRRVL